MAIDELRTVPILAGLSEAGYERVSRCSAEIDAAPGQVLVLPGDAASGAFVVLDGTVVVELRRGAVVGELALLVPDTGRVARVRASSQARCLSLPREDFLALVESEPSF